MIKGYHGTHFGAASVKGNRDYCTAHQPLLPGCHHIPAPYANRNPFNEADPARLAQLCLQALEDETAFQGAGTIAAFIMVPILGAGGVIPSHASFMPGVEALCRAERHPADRRRGDHRVRAHRRGVGVAALGGPPDFLCTARAITNGRFPFGAVLIAERVVEVVESDTSGKAAIAHGAPYSGHPVGAAAALACLAETRRLNVTDNAAARGAELFAGARALRDRFDVIGEVRGGHGLMGRSNWLASAQPDPPRPGPRPTRCRPPPFRPGRGCGCRGRTSSCRRRWC